ncbi:MAG: AMP-binding protein [Muribaculaceae bacterium]|jgi:acetyl-CoA synthetase|nr:AMP-binding protein [Muribaculaceae bacterium]
MLNKYLDKIEFENYNDFLENFKINVPENFNFGYDIVDEWARISPNKKALLWTNDQGKEIQFTFADIKRESDKAASYFTQLGIKRGDMVMIVLKRRYQFWMVITALHKIGAAVIPATHLLTEKDIIYRAKAADIKAIVAAGDEEVVKHIEKARPNCPTVTNCISIGPIIPEGWDDYNRGVEEAPEFVRPELANTNDDISLMYFTSGTTGEPKMVAHDFTYPLGHIITAKYWHNLNEDSLHLTLADTGWGKAVWGKYYGQWIVGANVFVYDYEKFTPVDLLAIFEKYHITSFCAPPTVFRFLIREDISKYDLSALRYCTIAGEALNPSVYEKWKELTGIKLFEAFGQTETTITVGTYPMVEPRPGSMGKKGPVYDIDLMKPDGTWAEDGEQGEIVVRTHGKQPVGLFKEYYRDPELTKEAYDNGIYHTGDVAWRDEDGYYWFIGRKDDVIKSSGYRIGPFEVESALMTHPAVVECAITGVPDEIRGQVVKATIVLSADYKDKAGEALIAEIQDHVKRTTAPYKYPRIIEFVDELPKTISGKIRRVEIRKKNNQ